MEIQGRIYKLKEEEKQIRKAMKGPYWLRKEKKELEYFDWVEEASEDLEEYFIKNNPELFRCSENYTECVNRTDFQEFTEAVWRRI